MHFGMRFFEQRSVITRNAANHVRVDTDAVVGEHGESRNVFEQLHVCSPKGEGKIRRQRRGDAETLGHIHDGVDADFFSEFYGRDVS